MKWTLLWSGSVLAHWLNPLLILWISHWVRVKGASPYWNPAVVIPIFKSDDPHSVSNYRPISSLPAMSKVIEKLVADQLILHLNSSQLLHPMQHGFRAHHSTETTTVYFIERVKSLMDRGVVGAIFFFKIVQFNFSQYTSNWFKSYLTNQSQCVKIQM